MRPRRNWRERALRRRSRRRRRERRPRGGSPSVARLPAAPPAPRRAGRAIARSARRDPARDFARDRRFDDLAAEENVAGVGDGRRRDEGAAIALERDDVVMGERLQRAAHERSARVEDRAELFFGEFGARRQALIDDRLENAAVDRLGPRAATDRPASAPGRWPLLRNDRLQHDAECFPPAGSPLGYAGYNNAATVEPPSPTHFVYNSAEIVDTGA